MHPDMNWLSDMTEEQATAEMARFRRVVEQRYQQAAAAIATGFRDARDSVREAAVRGQGTRNDRAYRRGLRGRGQR